MFLLDTDIMSALRKKKRVRLLDDWLQSTRPSDMFVSVITIGEIERGVSAKRRTDPDFGTALADWLDSILIDFDERIVPFDLNCARRWGRLGATIGNMTSDLQIAATALEHGLTVVTRNVAHFRPTGVATVDPFKD
ncbi:MAG: type II toxin-antitoxin system VapC family toxin [Parvularculaceae bacterium]|nr:type II toxin-antitoxin system VapC family toxin [Parvularculaceae bacterium]